MASKPAPPKGLKPGGSELWRDIVGKWELRPDELRILRKACREVERSPTRRFSCQCCGSVGSGSNASDISISNCSGQSMHCFRFPVLVNPFLR